MLQAQSPKVRQTYNEIMKFASVLAILVISLTAIAAPTYETNGQRMARGLPPLSPVNLNKRGTPAAGMSAYSPPTIRYISYSSLPLAVKRGQPSVVARSLASGAKRAL